jgi:hypothetical protein
MADPVIDALESTGVQASSNQSEQSTAQLAERRDVHFFISYSHSEISKSLHSAFQDFFRSTEQALQQDQHVLSDRLYEERIAAEPVQLPVRLKKLPPRSTFSPIEEWEGAVLSIEGDSFTARLANKTDSQAPEEEGQFDMAQLSSAEDRNLVVPGSIFYFSVGYEESPSGQRRISAFLRFRRLPAWTSAELKEIEAEADRLAGIFGPSTEQGQSSSG